MGGSLWGGIFFSESKASSGGLRLGEQRVGLLG